MCFTFYYLLLPKTSLLHQTVMLHWKCAMRDRHCQQVTESGITVRNRYYQYLNQTLN